MSETSTRIYELGFLLAPTTPENEVEKMIDVLKAAITETKGEILSTGNPEYIDLAYQMEKTFGSKKVKYDQAYFGSLKFQAEPEALAVIKKTLDGIADLVRYILIKTTVENTIVFKKPKVEPKRGEAVIEPEEEITEEETVDDVQEDHEKLPDVQGDMTDAPAAEPAEKEEI